MEEQLYIIHWKSMITGYTGQGTAAFTKRCCNQIIRGQQDKNIVYWIVPTKS